MKQQEEPLLETMMDTVVVYNLDDIVWWGMDAMTHGQLPDIITPGAGATMPYIMMKWNIIDVQHLGISSNQTISWFNLYALYQKPNDIFLTTLFEWILLFAIGSYFVAGGTMSCPSVTT